MHPTRRAFLSDVSKGMIVAGLGSALAADLGFDTAFADERPNELTFGHLEPLVRLLQETDANKLTPILVDRIRQGTELKTLVQAAALANARTFGGEDYVGFHTMMALGPAWEMARELPDAQKPLPVLKVLYRNSNRIREKGGRSAEVLKPVHATKLNGDPATLVRAGVKAQKAADAEVALVSLPADDAFNAILDVVEDATEVHRVVTIWRAWDLRNIVGREHAHTMLRQSVRYCVNAERSMGYFKNVRVTIPKVLDAHKLAGKKLGSRAADDQWLKATADAIFRAASPEQGAGIVGQAIAEGFSADAISEAIRLASNDLVLLDPGRPKNQTSPNKPEGSVHGDGIGVHACDSANAWTNLAKSANPANAIVCLLLAGYQIVQDRDQRGGDFLKRPAFPGREDTSKIGAEIGTDPAKLLAAAESAIRAKDQKRAATVAAVYAAVHDAGPLFGLLRKYAISEDGALHAEKFYRTVTEACAGTRPAFRAAHLASPARVTASAFGYAAPGQDEARRLLKV